MDTNTTVLNYECLVSIAKIVWPIQFTSYPPTISHTINFDIQVHIHTFVHPHICELYVYLHMFTQYTITRICNHFRMR